MTVAVFGFAAIRLSKAACAGNQMEGRAAVASVSTGHTATTERGPPDHPKRCAQNAKLPLNGL